MAMIRQWFVSRHECELNSRLAASGKAHDTYFVCSCGRFGEAHVWAWHIEH